MRTSGSSTPVSKACAVEKRTRASTSLSFRLMHGVHPRTIVTFTPLTDDAVGGVPSPESLAFDTPPSRIMATLALTPEMSVVVMGQATRCPKVQWPTCPVRPSRSPACRWAQAPPTFSSGSSISKLRSRKAIAGDARTFRPGKLTGTPPFPLYENGGFRISASTSPKSAWRCLPGPKTSAMPTSQSG